MNRLKSTSIALTMLLSITSFAQGNNLISIPPIGKAQPKMSAKAKIERVTLVGPLRTIPMSGAKTTIQSGNFGQVVLFAPMDLDATALKQVEKWEAEGIHVKVSGSMATVCSARELKAEILGCRWMDTRIAITIQKY